MAVERVLSNLNLISFKTEGGLQNHIDELQDGDLVFTPDNSLKGNLFDFKWTDHKLNDISWLNADTFSWQSGDVYVAAYNHLVEDFGKLYAWALGAGAYYYTLTETPAVGDNVYSSNKNDEPSIIDKVDSGTITFVDPRSGDQRVATRDATGDSTPFVLGIGLKTETISSTTVTYFQAEDGHKICLADQESNVLALYEATGVAWYYILDTANKQFKLPRTKFGFTGMRDEVGNYVEAGLPNITGAFNSYAYNVGNTRGAIASTISKPNVMNSGSETSYNYVEFTIDASRSSSVYGNSDTVQPKATQMYLYFYVGNFEREAVEQTAGLNTEMFNDKADVSLLENKANTDLSNLTSAGKEKLSIKSYSVTGEMFNASTDSVAGTGSARVYLMPYGKVIIDFVIRITTGGTSSSEFNCGLNRDLLRYLNNNIPVITPLGGTYAHYNTSGYLSQSKTGYGGNLAKAGQFWQFGRVYQADGKAGGWPASNFAKDEYLVGTAWGTYEI